MAVFLCTLHKDKVNSDIIFYTSYTNVFLAKTLLPIGRILLFPALFLTKRAEKNIINSK